MEKCLRSRVTLLFLCTLITACSGIRPYANGFDKNLRVKIDTDSGSVFTTIQTLVHIYSVDSNCQTAYEGSVRFKQASVDIGLPGDRLSYLGFVFVRSGLLSNSTGTISYYGLIKPRSGYRYEASVRYKDQIYHVELEEVEPRSGVRTRLEMKDLHACQQ